MSRKQERRNTHDATRLDDGYFMLASGDDTNYEMPGDDLPEGTDRILSQTYDEHWFGKSEEKPYSQPKHTTISSEIPANRLLTDLATTIDPESVTAHALPSNYKGGLQRHSTHVH